MKEYDLTILGSGPGGYIAALYAAQHGLRTCLIEKDKIGGVCLNAGCIPAKTLFASARLAADIKDAASFGITVGEVSIDMAAINKRKNDIVGRLRQGVEALLKARKVDVRLGAGRLEGGDTVSVGGETLKSKNIIIATGSRPLELAFMRFDGKCVISSNDILELKDAPGHLAVVGGGVIGCEFAGIFSEFGSKVTMIEMMDTLVPGIDPEMAKRLEAALRRRGIRILTKTKVRSAEIREGREVILETEGAVTEKIACAKALVCVGRRLNVEDIGLEKAGVRASSKGIAVNEYLRTSADNIYAIGDVIGGHMYAHVASHEGILACDNILGRKRAMDYNAVPAVIFTNPDIASVGTHETAARARGLDIDVAVFHFRSLGKAHILGKIDGMIKIVSEKGTGRILGVDIIGENAAEMIAEATLAIKMGGTIEDVINTIHAHPTMPEALMEASHKGAKKPLHSL